MLKSGAICIPLVLQAGKRRQLNMEEDAMRYLIEIHKRDLKYTQLEIIEKINNHYPISVYRAILERLNQPNGSVH